MLCVCLSYEISALYFQQWPRARLFFSVARYTHSSSSSFFLRCVSSASFSSLLFHSTHFDPRVPVYVHSKLRLYILFSIEIHHSLAYNRSIASSYMHTHTRNTHTQTAEQPCIQARTEHTHTHIHTFGLCWVSVRVLPQRKSSITSLAHIHQKERIRTHSL